MNVKTVFASRKGFTLIELLVVIGILAVLAAIAIPSVAGLIDRANVSADKTNANEMTNAIERFTSEYELYCQDIASGAIKDADNNGTPDDMDAAQGRVFNVTGVVTRSDITALESTGLNGKQINRDTKYPVDAATMQAVVENYTKTSSATFEPKQSDMHYWYSPDCGVVVFDEPDATVADLNSQIQSGMDAKGNQLSATTQWIDLTLGVSLGGGNSLDMSNVKPNLEENDWATIQKVIQAGQVANVGWKVGDISPAFTINDQTNFARIIGINHDGINTVTFMIINPIGVHAMNSNGKNDGGWEKSEMRLWLNSTVINGMSNKDYIKSVQKETNNIGKNGNSVSKTTDFLTLLSIRELGLDNQMRDVEYWTYQYPFFNAIDAEGKKYEYFNTNTMNDFVWLRSPGSLYDTNFFISYDYKPSVSGAENTHNVLPIFVIG